MSQQRQVLPVLTLTWGSGVSAVDTVEAEVRELVRRRGLDRVEDRAAVCLVDEVAEPWIAYFGSTPPPCTAGQLRCPPR